jgi:hypothetical protein
MRATKIRQSLIATALAALVVPAAAASLGIDSRIVQADTVTPQNIAFTACLCSGTRLTIHLGGSTTVTCTTSCVVGTTPGSSSAPGAPVCGTISAPTLGGCTLNTSGAAVSCAVAGSWSACVTPTTVQLTGGTVRCAINLVGQTCSLSSVGPFNGTWSNATSSATFNQVVPFTTSGGFPCPSGTSASFSASYCTNPALTVSDP